MPKCREILVDTRILGRTMHLFIENSFGVAGSGSVDKVFCSSPFLPLYLSSRVKVCAVRHQISRTHARASGGNSSNKRCCSIPLSLSLLVGKHWNACRAVKLADTIPKSSKEINKESNLKRGQVLCSLFSVLCSPLLKRQFI